MKLSPITPAKSLNKAYLKQSLKREQIELFKANLVRLFERIRVEEHEEHLKNLVADFLKDTWYKPAFEINTSKRTDLVIHTGKSSDDPIAAIIEAKKPSNRAEMITPEKPNVKALHELLHYYMQERYIRDNKEIKHLIICNIYEWYIFDAADFERFFFGNHKLVKSYKDWNDGLLVSANTDWFYQEIAKPFIEKELIELPCVCFDLHDFEKIVRHPDKVDDKKLINLYKILSPPHLLKQPFANDSNSLNKEFYSELLHIIGLEEVKEKGKKLIRRKAEGERHEGSLLENSIDVLRRRNKVSLEQVESNSPLRSDDICFETALELCITWLNRLLFLKLLEGQLIAYHKGDRAYTFLNSNRIADFDEVNELFFEVLAVRVNERNPSVQAKFGNIPYLNSSLFEESDLERATIRINELKNRLDLPLYGTTVLKGSSGKRLSGDKNTLTYLFEFLDAYDFSTEGSAEIQEQNKAIINASVLGLIFEKINGYRDGSFFTPGFITMYICRETIRRAVLRKFNDKYGWACSTITELYNRIDPGKLKEANETVNSLKICDPAVGSGHFLVSALNEIIAVKSDLGILTDQDGKRLREYAVSVENDELIVTHDEQLFTYNFKDPESQRVQETLFHEKETIIENCLFGVDINPKSVSICRLRLWIELLKNAYYRRGTNELETLPNIDINIKCGNSLVSRFAVAGNPNSPVAQRKKLKELTAGYRDLVLFYKHSPSNKAELRKRIDNLKHDLENFGLPNDKDLVALRKKENEVAQLGFAFDKKGTEARQKLLAEVAILQERFVEKERLVYANAFEWRFEFPEVLDEAGEFIGFDAVIGNPPYIRQEAIKEQKPAFMEMFGDFYCGTADIYTYFYKTGLALLKQDGLLCYIAPNKFMRAGYGRNTRELLTTQATPLQVLDFGDLPVFEEATTYPSIVMVGKKIPPPRSSPPGGGISVGKDIKMTPPPCGGRSGGGNPGATEKKLFIPVSVPTPLLEAARALRSTMTDAEKLLWQCLRGKQLGGYRFRRQHPIERYVLDFYCCEAKLAVELDGGHHNEADARVRDNERTALLEQQGIQVIRFWNNDVFANFEGVLESVYMALQQRTSTTSPLPTSPRWGEEMMYTEGKGDKISSLHQRGRVGEGEKFLTATFTDPEQLKRLDQVLTSIGFTMPVAALSPEGWTLERPEVLALMGKLRKRGKQLAEYVDKQIYYGIKTGLNEAFIIDGETRSRLIAEDAKSADIIKPWLRGKDIFKWKTQWAGLYVLFTRRGTDIEHYPAIKHYLAEFREHLEPKKSDKDTHGRKPGPYKWFEIQDNIAYYEEFEKPKILWPGISAVVNVFSLDEEGFYGNDNNQLIISGDRFLLAVLNSQLTSFILKQICDKVQGGFYRLKIIYIEQLPIPTATDTQKAPIIDHVQKILANPASPDVPRLEAEIDRLVYDLYGLTDEEIALVEGKA